MNVLGERRRSSRDVIEPFLYPELPDSVIPDWELWGGGGPESETFARASVIDMQPPAVDLEQRLAEETRRSFEAGRAQGIEQGRAHERAAQGTVEERLAAHFERLAAAFKKERDRYLDTADSEVVKLALAIAARVLRREAQMDPLLLNGAVRVALGQLAAGTTATLRIPPAELDLWKDAIALVPNLAIPTRIVPGDGMRLGDCILETSLGSVDLGVRAQLSEIERGFFDRATGTNPELALAGKERRP